MCGEFENVDVVVAGNAPEVKREFSLLSSSDSIQTDCDGAIEFPISRGERLKPGSSLTFDIGNEFADMKEVKALSKNLLNNENIWKKYTSGCGAIPDYQAIAQEVLTHWLSQFTDCTTGRNLLEALTADDATLPIAEKYATALVPGLGRFPVFFFFISYSMSHQSCSSFVNCLNRSMVQKLWLQCQLLGVMANGWLARNGLPSSVLWEPLA